MTKVRPRGVNRPVGARPPRKKQKPFLDSTTKKVIAVCMIMMAITLPLIGVALYMRSNSPSYSRTPPAHSLLNKFEHYLAGFAHNGDWMVRAPGRSDIYACGVTESLKGLDNCLYYGEYVRDTVAANPSLSAEVSKQTKTLNKGFVIEADGMPIKLGINPKVRANYEKALRKIEDTVLIENFHKSDIEATLKNVHKVMVEGLSHENGLPIRGGSYRNGALLVQPEDKGLSGDLLIDYVKEKHGEEGYGLFTKAYEKFVSTRSTRDMDAQERAIWDSIFYTAPEASKLPALMKQFAAEYSEKLKSNTPPFELAAWVHMQIVDLHPFIEFNGKLARTMMNAEIKRQGLTSVVFFDDKEYTEAINEEHRRPGAFADYLVASHQKSLALRQVKEFPQLI